MRRIVELIIATGRNQLWHTRLEGVRCRSDPTVMHFSKMSGRHGTEKIDHFADWYRENFDGRALSAIGAPRMVLVGLGADEATKRMVEFLATSDVDMTLITFYGFNDTA
jgi:hypothetical protein